MDLGIRGRIAVVTGGDSGMGYATAEMLLKEGVKVVLTDLPGGPLQEAEAVLKHLGDVVAVAADLTKTAQVDDLKQATMDSFGLPDILVHAAGITGPTGPFHELTDEDWLKALQSDLLAAVRVCRAFIPAMAEAGWGRVVLFGSEDAQQPYTEELPYCASKAAILNLSKGLSKSYSRQGVLVNAVSPAVIATPMTDEMMKKRAEKDGITFDEALRSFLAEERPTLELQRRGTPGEVAAAVVFLCSSHASFINGANLRVDGGSVATV